MTNIFVGNLSFDTTQSDLESSFGQFGAVDRVQIVTDRATGQPRGFAFVEMSDRQAADAAIAQLNGTELRGRAMNVNEARPKPEGGARMHQGGGFNRRPGGGPRRDGNRGSRW
jgi:RNA recognition motif-containing protein